MFLVMLFFLVRLTKMSYWIFYQTLTKYIYLESAHSNHNHFKNKTKYMIDSIIISLKKIVYYSCYEVK